MGTKITEHHWALPKTLALISDATDGVTIYEIAAALGVSVGHSKNLMSALSRQKACVCVHLGGAYLWMLPKRAAQKLAERAAADPRLERRRQSELRRRRDGRKKRPLKPAAPETGIHRELSDRPTVVCVPAWTKPPVQTLGVRSVFELAEAL